MKGRIAFVAILSALTAACVGGGEVRRPVRTSRPATRPAPRPAPVYADDAAYRLCTANLTATQVTFSPLPNEEKGSGCALIGTVKLLDYGTPTTNLGPMTCEVAARFIAWVRYAVRPAARLYFGSDVAQVETYGTYACRNIVGNPNMAGKRSEHAHGNAVDIAAFVLADGRRISIQNNWASGGVESQFLHRVHDSACKRFKTVLSPDYNAAHYNHLHFDMGGKGGYCR
ncbi:MAG TPA: extensin family protein [Sphingobium sp.]|uniref:extensin-like domain-containing protein n=1 Tax=Sphingobium sp. TaxID=1912891 RepID=UPI002ED253EB